MDFSLMRLEPLQGRVVRRMISTTSSCSNVSREVEDSTRFNYVNCCQKAASLSSSAASSFSSSSTNSCYKEITTNLCKKSHKPDPPGQCANELQLESNNSDSGNSNNLPPIKSLTIRNGKIRNGSGDGNDDDNNDNDSSSSSNTNTDVSLLSSNASPVFHASQACRHNEQQHLIDFYSALFHRHLHQSARSIQAVVRGMIQRRKYKYRDDAYSCNDDNNDGCCLTKAMMELECIVCQFSDYYLPTTETTATTAATKGTSTHENATTTTTTNFTTIQALHHRPIPIRDLSRMSVTTLDEAHNLVIQQDKTANDDDDDDLNIPTSCIVGGKDSSRHDNHQVQMPQSAAAATAAVPCCISSLCPTNTTQGFSSSRCVMPSTTELLHPNLSSRECSSMSMMTDKIYEEEEEEEQESSSTCSSNSSRSSDDSSSINAYYFDANNTNYKATPTFLLFQKSKLSSATSCKIDEEDSCLDYAPAAIDDYFVPQRQEVEVNDDVVISINTVRSTGYRLGESFDIHESVLATTDVSCQNDDDNENNDVELATLNYVGSFDNIYINVDGNNQSNKESALTTPGSDVDDDDDDDDASVNHLSITKWLANEAQDFDKWCRGHGDDDETASTSADITDSSTDYDLLESLLAAVGNDNSSASTTTTTTLEAPPPPAKADCYCIPSIADYAPVQKRQTSTTM